MNTINPHQVDLARGLAKLFNQTADGLNDIIVEAEEALASIGLHVPANVQCEQGRLHFGRTNKKWRLSYKGDEHQEPQLLTNCSLHIRCGAVKHLHELLDEMLLSTRYAVQEIQTRTADIQEFVAQVKEFLRENH